MSVLRNRNLRSSASICGQKTPLFYLCLLMAIPAVAAPELECDTTEYDFGTRVEAKQIIHEFILHNGGDSPLKITKVKNCCGVSAKVEPMEIPPGSNAVCRMVFNTNNRYGLQNKQVLLSTNAGNKRYLSLTMTGTLLKPVEFSPRYIRLQNVQPDAAVSEIITVTNLLGEAITLESLSTTVTGLEAEVVRDDASRLHPATGNDADQTSAPRRSWTIQVRSSSALAPGPVNGKVQLNFSTGTVDVPVIGNVRRDTAGK